MNDPTWLVDDPTVSENLRSALAEEAKRSIAPFDVDASAAKFEHRLQIRSRWQWAARALVAGTAVVAIVGITQIPPSSPSPSRASAHRQNPGAPPRQAPSRESAVSETKPNEMNVDIPTFQAHDLPEAGGASKTLDAPRKATSAAPKPDATEPDDKELAALLQLRSLVRTDPARAIAQASADNARFPRGTLRAERDILAIMALERAGRKAEAQSRAKEYLQKYVDTPFRDTATKIAAGDSAQGQ